MTSVSDWFRDERMLLGELRHHDARGPRLPSIEGYDQFREIRRGGQGVVYSAVQRSTRRRVAVKVLLDGAWASDMRRRRFEREVDLIASLQHPNIVQLYDSGLTDEAHPYYVMAFIDGAGLDELIATRDEGGSLPTASLDALDARAAASPPSSPLLSARATLSLMARVCDAVAYAHQRGVIHRDLKPSNIRIDPEGQPHVLDFGLAKLALTGGDAAQHTQMSRTGEFLGSLPWASPEQAEGLADRIDTRSDVYALGVILFQALTGRFPYPVVGSLRQVLDHILTTEPTRPSAARGGLDDEIDTIVLKCLAKAPDRRYQSAGELARDLRRYLAGEPIEAKGDSAWYTLRKNLHRYRTATRVSGAFLALTLVGLIVMSVLRARAVEAEQLAEQRRQAVELAREAEATARAQAEREAAQARAVSRFLEGMLATPVDLGREARVADVLDTAAAELSAGDALGEDTEAALRGALGTAYATLGLYEQARPLLAEALRLRERARGPDDPETLRARSNVAWLHRLRGDLHESERLYTDVLARLRALPDAEPRDLASAMNDLALVLEDFGRLEEAEELHRVALAIITEAAGPHSRDALTCMGNLASVLHYRGRMEEAEELMRARLAGVEALLGREHRDVITAMNNLAALLADMNRPEEAESLRQAVFEGRSRLLGEDHPQTIVALNNLADSVSTRGELAEAERLLRIAFERASRRLSPAHPDRMTVMDNLASVLRDRGAMHEAESMFRELLELRREALGDEHPSTLITMNNLATLLHFVERLEEAGALYRQVSEAAAQVFGDEHPFVLTSLLNYAILAREQGRLDESEPVIRHVLETRTRLFGADATDTLVARLEAAKLRLDRGDADGAAADMRGVAAAASEGPLGAEHWYTALFRGFLGRCLLSAERYEEAESELLTALDLLRARFGLSHAHTRTTLERLLELYERTGRHEDAQGIREMLAPAGAGNDEAP